MQSSFFFEKQRFVRRSCKLLQRKLASLFFLLSSVLHFPTIILYFLYYYDLLFIYFAFDSESLIEDCFLGLYYDWQRIYSAVSFYFLIYLSSNFLSINIKNHFSLYVRGIFTGFKRGQRNQHEHTALLKLENVHTSKDARFYLGKRAVYVYRGVKKISHRGRPKSNIRCIWGKVTRTHGNSGAVRAKFHRNLPPQAMGKLIRVVSFSRT